MEEGLFPVIVLIISAVSGIISAASKGKKNDDAKRAFQQRTAAKPAAAPSSMASMLPVQSESAQPQVTVSEPTVHTHLTPDCETHDAPGSLGAVSNEGKDPCHAEQLTALRNVHDEEEETPALTLDWTGESLVKSFIMQEVFTRPCQRRAAR